MTVTAADLSPLLTTEQKKLARLLDTATGPTVKHAVVPGIDTAALSRRFGMGNAYKPKLREAGFRVPIGASYDQFEKIAKAAWALFLKVSNTEGWDYHEAYGPPQFDPGVYPARDLTNNEAQMDQREFMVRAWFRKRSPKPVRIEIDPAWTKPTILGHPPADEAGHQEN